METTETASMITEETEIQSKTGDGTEVTDMKKKRRDTEMDTSIEETEAEIKNLNIKVLRLGKCEICCENEAKYNCPACNAKTCSLGCVKEHKTNSLCTGVRDRVKMIHKEDMDNLTLLSDYRFLEEIDHKLENNMRNPVLRRANMNPQFKPKMPQYMYRLREEAWKRGTTLKYLPYQFSSRRNNKTRYYNSEGVIRWQVKLIFHQADVTLTEVDVDENTSINKILARSLDPNSDLPDDVKEKLMYYQSASFSGIAVLMRSDVEGQMIFQELFPNKSLKANLANKTVIETPTLYVILKHHIDTYLGYEGEEDDDLFPSSEEVKESQTSNMQFFDAENDALTAEMPSDSDSDNS